MHALSRLQTAAPPQTSHLDAAERRQVTVMFSDLVGLHGALGSHGSGGLARGYSAYQRCVTETVRRFGGFVANYMGDGVLGYFGYPRTTKRTSSGLCAPDWSWLRRDARGLKTHVALQARVGIATGLVVIGDLSGSGDTQERGVVGETPNLAGLRLRSLADPNMVVIAEGTRKLIGKLFRLKDLGTRDLKGIAGPVKCWSVLRASAVESRFEAFHASDLTEVRRATGRTRPAGAAMVESEER